MAQRAISLGPKPSLFVFFYFLLFKGQVRWPEAPPHLALNPPYLIFLFLGGGLFFPFLSLLFIFNTKQYLFFPQKRAFLFIFESLPLLLLRLFWPPPFSIYLLCLSLSLSLSFFSLFLLSCLSFLLSFGSFFLSLSFLLFLLCFVS